jgi:ABC-type nickel/cobalt efflux system permease component RcnA
MDREFYTGIAIGIAFSATAAVASKVAAMYTAAKRPVAAAKKTSSTKTGCQYTSC